MARLVLALAALQLAGVAAEEDFQDSPLLSSLWQSCSSNDDDSIDRLLDSSENAVKARASDGRGLAWWAWEFQNTYALGAIMAFGGDPESTSEDIHGETAVSMCTGNEECDKDDLLAQAAEKVPDIKARREQRAKEAAADDDDEEEDIDDDEF